MSGTKFRQGLASEIIQPIFYSLGNFIFQNETVAAVPADFYEKYDFDPALAMTETFDLRSQNGARGLAANPKAWSSVVAHWTMEGEELVDLTLHPISLGFGLPRCQAGWPSLSQDRSTLENIAHLSQDFGTEFALTEAGTAVWKKPAL